MPPPAWGGGPGCSQLVLEVLVGAGGGPPGIMCSQLALEVLLPFVGNLGCTQLALEVLLLPTTTITWPSDLPQAPRVDELRDLGASSVLRSEMTQGPAKVRPTSTATPRPFEVAFDMRGDQVASLETFYQATTQQGTIPFIWKSPRTGRLAEFRFTSQPMHRPQGPRAGGGEWWRVTFGVEQMPGTEQAP